MEIHQNGRTIAEQPPPVYLDSSELPGYYDLGPKPPPHDLLPAWFTEGLLDTDTAFGFVISTGATVVAQRIDAIRRAADGALWIDVTLADSKFCGLGLDKDKTILAPSARKASRASINSAHIVAVFELQSR